MKDLTGMIDVDVESLMHSAGNNKKEFEDVIRKRQQSRTLAFDARNEVSADARYIAGRIVHTMWVIGVGIPLVACLLMVVFK